MLIQIVLVFLGIRGTCIKAEIGMPLIQIGHDDLGEDYPEVREEVHLDDFFWTGSGDGPPDYLKKVHTGISKGKDVIVKTETVVATVYVDGNNEIDIPICLDCPPDDGGGTWGVGNIPHLNYTSTDRRYWLLTVLSGFYSQKDNPGLEEKLARLYRLAFTRQQSKHLGINGDQQINRVAVPSSRDRTDTRKHNSDYEILDMRINHTPTVKIQKSKEPPIKRSTELLSSDESETQASDETTISSSKEILSSIEDSTKESSETIVPWELIQRNVESEKLLSIADMSLGMAKKLRVQQWPLIRDSKVRVIIHNITQITAGEIQKGKTSGLYDEDVNVKIEERPTVNQTELIYSVLVNGRPVLAVAAANDMKLVLEAEVEDTFGKDVIMKAEPYLHEPQATPLAPATRSGSIGFIDSIQNHTALVIVSTVALLLLLLLLLALLLMGRSRIREKNADTNRSSIQNDLLSDRSVRATSSITAIDTARSTARSHDVGVQNIAFEEERIRNSNEARINFPGPPNYERSPQRDSLTSSGNTSDSSIYCPINAPNSSGQNLLDGKAATLFEKHKKRHEYDRAEGHEKPVYTSVVSEKSREKTRQKTKRKYLSENRVGSLENSPTQRAVLSSGEEIVTDSVDGDSLRPTYEHSERTEAFNIHNNYNRNKLIHQKTFTNNEELHLKSEDLQSSEAINTEIIRALQPSGKSSDTGSIGSFLSMASVKAFPKSTLPEPLNKVLEPVFVTYYDNVEEQRSTKAADQKPSSVRTQKPQRKHNRQQSLDAQTIATIESFPSPKAPGRMSRLDTQSDTPDPGVVGLIVWERHKKRLNDEANIEDTTSRIRNLSGYSPIRDPAAMRNHFEGLLEGAIQMYSSQDDLPTPLPARDFTNNRRPTKREFRGSSAGISGNTMKTYHSSERPATAHVMKTPKSNQSTQPSSPTSGAWGGSIHGSYSPVRRPFSAGPVYQSEFMSTRGLPRSHKQISKLDAAPLVEALQHELQKYRKDTN